MLNTKFFFCFYAQTTSNVTQEDTFPCRKKENEGIIVKGGKHRALSNFELSCRNELWSSGFLGLERLMKPSTAADVWFSSCS